MSQVQLQVRPRRVRCSEVAEPPPFRFAVGAAAEAAAADSTLPAVVRLPMRGVALLFVGTGKIIDAAFFLFAITVWCALHLTLWSYAFELGPAADCFGLPCPAWLRPKVIIGCAVLAVLSFVVARVLRRLGHRATAAVLLVLVTFDVSALLLLGIHAVT